MTGTPMDPTHGCALFGWRRDRDGRPAADIAIGVLRAIAARLQEQDYDVSEVAPGKGCLAAFDVVDSKATVTVVAGEHQGSFWIAIWESADESASMEGYKPSATLAAVRSVASSSLCSEDAAVDVKWMTLRAWAILDKERRAAK